MDVCGSTWAQDVEGVIMTTWFTSDSHFGHTNIINYCNRPFISVDEMDAVLIDNWNNLVGDDDIVYHLGDFTLSGRLTAQKYFSRLKGLIRVLENPWHHDRGWLSAAYIFTSGSNLPIQILPPMVVLELPEYGDGGYPKPLVLCHYPLAMWDRKHYGAWHLHGHSHGKYHAPDNACIYDVGVDSNNFKPVSLKSIAQWMKIMERVQALAQPVKKQ